MTKRQFLKAGMQMTGGILIGGGLMLGIFYESADFSVRHHLQSSIKALNAGHRISELQTPPLRAPSMASLPQAKL